jgi:hypothetical protein
MLQAVASLLTERRRVNWAEPNWALQGTLTRRIASATPYGRP